MKNDIATIARRFRLPGGELSFEPFGSGYINSTYRVTVQTKRGRERFILQRVNRNVFTRPQEVIANIERVTEHLRAVIAKEGGDARRGTLTLVPAKDGKSYTLDEGGELWRMYVFIEGTVAYDAADTPVLFSLSGAAFGRFARQMDGFPADSLFETIPGFHDTPARCAQLKEAVRRDVASRRAGVQEEIDFFLSREGELGAYRDAHVRGEISLRVTHNDTKLNNVLLDEKTGQGVCVIDLDTVMPGFAGYDFGDAIRYGACTASEDERDLSKVDLSLEMFEAFARGYLGEAGSVLTRREIELLPLGAKLITLEQGMRFLADHLNGDAYYGARYPGHNLDRARTQLRLAQRMEEKWDDMTRIVSDLLGET